MRCAVCGAETRIKDSRPARDYRMVKRRRVCERGHGFYTVEAIITGSEGFVGVNKNSEETRRRSRLREEARKEAAETGEPVEAIYRAWGVLSRSRDTHG